MNAQKPIDASRCGSERKRKPCIDAKKLSLRKKKLESEMGKRIFGAWQERLNANFLEAAKEGRAKRAERLLKIGADMNATDEFGNRALHLAAWYGHIETCAILIDNGADVNAKDDNDGWTALMNAARYGYTKICELLVERGANIKKRAGDGSTALMLAEGYDKKETAGFLAFAIFAPMIFTDKKISDLFYSNFRGCAS